MLGKNWKSIPKLPCPDSDCLPHPNRVAGDSGNPATAPWASCNVCLEENKVCKCDNGGGVEEEEEKDFKTLVNVDNDVKHAVNANSSFAHAVINMTGMLIGLGQLSTPYALQNGGWASAFLLVGLGIICAYSSHLLGKCLDKNPKLMNYSDIGHLAFGTKGRAVATSLIYMEIFMALVSYTISLHDNLTRVFLGTHLKLPSTNLSTSQLLTVVAVLVALPSLWLRDLSSISFLSTAGILMSLVIFATVTCTASFGGVVKANHNLPLLQLRNIPSISGLYIFSYAGHIVFPNIYKDMKDPSKFTKVSIVSFSAVTMLYTALAFMGAEMFGAEVSSQITLSMPPNLIATKIALWATVLTPMTKYALEFAPFAMQLEQRHLPPSMKSTTRMIVRGSIGSFFLLAILALALSVPYFEYVLSLTGSLISVGICIILPCAFYTKVFWTKISKPLLILNAILIVLGCVLGVSGTISSSKLLIRNLH